MALGSILAQKFYLSNLFIQRAADDQATAIEDFGHGHYLSSERQATGLAFGRGRNRRGDWDGFAFCPPPLLRSECI
jgi:hypothetical protein